MTPMQVQDSKREGGFTLIELLVVVIIIGILAAIAIPVFLNQREGAQRNALKSSIQAAITQTEVAYTTNPAANTYQLATAAALTGMNLPPTVTITAPQFYGTPAGSTGYCIQGVDTRLGTTASTDEATTNTFHQRMSGTALVSIQPGACPTS